MFKIWGKLIKNTKIVRDITITDSSDETRTHKVFNALDKIVYEFDLSRPIWLELQTNSFRNNSKARFSQDNFIDHIDFDYLEIEMLGED